MSADPFTGNEPFELAALDEKDELCTLARALELSEGFKLFFVCCNLPNQRRRLIKDFQHHLSQVTAQEIHFDEPIRHLLDALRPRIAQPPPGAVFVSGLEYSLPTVAEAHAAPFVANLNAARNSFPEIVPCPLVLWVPEYVLAAIIRGAPDFFSIRSAVYYFDPTPAEMTALISSFTSGDAWEVGNLPAAEKWERVKAIEGLLVDYQALPPEQRDRQAEGRMLLRLANLYGVLGAYQKALINAEQALATSREIGDRRGESSALGNLGKTYFDLGEVTKAIEHHERALAISREIGDRQGEGNALANLGNASSTLGQVAKAVEFCERVLAISREIGDRQGEGRTLGNLGVIYKAIDEIEKAKAFWQEALIKLHPESPEYQLVQERLQSAA